MKGAIRDALIGLGLAIIAIAIITIIVSVIGSGTNTSFCKETSDTTAEYRVCLAFERCRTEFKDNPELSGSCIADIITGRNPFP